MGKMKLLVLAVLCIVLSAPAMAAKGKPGGKVSVTGDLKKDGNIIFNIDWTVDTAKYPGMNREQIRAAVKSEIWAEIKPMVESMTRGMNVSYDSHQFTLLKEHNDVMQERPDGTKLVALKLEVKFTAVAAPAAVAAVAPAPQPKSVGHPLEQRWNEI